MTLFYTETFPKTKFECDHSNAADTSEKLPAFHKMFSANFELKALYQLIMRLIH